MAERKTRDEVLGRIRSGRAPLEAALGRLSDERLVVPGLVATARRPDGGRGRRRPGRDVAQATERGDRVDLATEHVRAIDDVDEHGIRRVDFWAGWPRPQGDFRLGEGSTDGWF